MSNLGVLRLHEELKAGRPTLAVFRDLIRDVGTGQQGPFIGACSEGLRLLGEAQASKVKFRCADKQTEGVLSRPASQLAIDANRLVAARDWIGLSALLIAVSAGLDGIRGNLDFTGKSRRRDGKPTGTSATIPLKVEIVGQNPRVTTTKVNRNAAGDIVSTMHLEEDALQADEAGT